MFENAKMVRQLCQVSLQESEHLRLEFVLNTGGCCGVSIGESLERKRRV
jgi:hypothetical protein